MFIFATKSFLVGSVLVMLGFDLLGPHLGRKVSRGVYKIDINTFQHKYKFCGTVTGSCVRFKVITGDHF